MAQLWGGRFEKPTEESIRQAIDSVYFDKRLWSEDITGSIAHARMLCASGIISEEECSLMVGALNAIAKEIGDGRLEVTPEYEDIHSFVEAVLTDRIGDAGKKLHTGRSRNDQVALDMRLFIRSRIDETKDLILSLLKTVLDIMEANTDTILPGFTHLQKAQPTTLAHHFGAYFEMLRRDFERLGDCRKRMNLCPLGAGALAGTTYPLDRDMTAAELGFDGPTRNSMDSVSDRDYLIEFVFDLSLIMMHLSRWCEELILWNSNEYRFIEIDDSYSTGSSIMPQKKNPDVAELVRGKTGRVYGALQSLLVMMKGIPLAYNKDLQEDKEVSFDAVDTAMTALKLFGGMLPGLTFNKERMRESAALGFTNATDAADYLVRKGMPFRDAHSVIGKMVLYCIEKNCALEDLTLSELKEFSDTIDRDFYEAVALETCVSRRLTKGAPGQAAVSEEIREAGEFLSSVCNPDRI
ncbi:MAG: argininosuccinate lyase [Lachnospiraceae bacterium]|nr:argininosuccinate lyase [Lachnospiraceae bacterium]